MKKLMQFSATFILAILLMSAKPYSKKATIAEPFVVYVPAQETFYAGGCAVTITTTIAFVFDDETFQLIAAALSGDYYIQINCGGPPSNFTRNGSEVSFDVSHNEVTDVDFPTTGIRDLDDIFSNPSFKSDFVEMINDSKPSY